MIITKVDSVVRDVPLLEVQHKNGIAVDGKQNILFVRIETDNGSVGYGEASSWSVFTGMTAQASREVVRGIIAPAILGRPFTRTAELSRTLAQLPHVSPHPRSAVDMAIVDVNSRSLNVPAHRVLGGASLRWQLSFSLSAETPEEVAELAIRRSAEGYTIFKLKVGARPDLDPDRLRALREVAPGATIRLDYNGSGTEKGLKQIRSALDECDVDFIEQPLPPGQEGLLSTVRGKLGCRIAWDESVGGGTEIRQLSRAGICDVITLKVGRTGSLSAITRLGELAEELGISVYPGAMNESVLGMSASMAAFSTLGNLVPGCDFYYPYTVLGDPGLSGGGHIDAGELVCSDAAGHGVSIPEEWFS